MRQNINSGIWTGSGEIDLDTSPITVTDFDTAGTYRIVESATTTYPCSSGPATGPQTAYSVTTTNWALLDIPTEYQARLNLSVLPGTDGYMRIPSPFHCQSGFCDQQLSTRWDQTSVGAGSDCYSTINVTNSASGEAPNNFPSFNCFGGDIVAVDLEGRRFVHESQSSFLVYPDDPNSHITSTCKIEVISLIGQIRLEIASNRTDAHPLIPTNDLTPGKAATPIVVTVTATRDGAPLVGIPITLKTVADYRKGGHSHAPPETPLADQVATTAAGGIATFSVVPGTISGKYSFWAEGPSNSKSSRRIALIAVPHLLPLSGPRWVVDVGTHPGDGFWGQPVLVKLMRKTSLNIDVMLSDDRALRNFCSTQLRHIKMGGMSLRYGGIFDICWSSTACPVRHPDGTITYTVNPLGSPHISHRIGNDADISTNPLSLTCRNVLYSAIAAAAGGDLDAEVSWPEPAASPALCADPAAPLGLCNHWHLRVRIEDPPPPAPTDFGTRSPITVQIKEEEKKDLSYHYSLRNNVSDSAINRWALEFTGGSFARVSSPEGWAHAFFGDDAGIYWAAVHEKDDPSFAMNISPGADAAVRNAIAKSFSIQHPMPPRVAAFSLFPFARLEANPEEGTRGSRREPRTTTRGVIRGYTVAPRDLHQMGAETVLDELSKEIELLCKLKWIAVCGPGIAKLHAHLRAARQASAASDAPVLKESLSAFLRDVDSLNRKRTLSESAYAILKLNARYLLDHPRRIKQAKN